MWGVIPKNQEKHTNYNQSSTEVSNKERGNWKSKNKTDVNTGKSEYLHSMIRLITKNALKQPFFIKPEIYKTWHSYSTAWTILNSRTYRFWVFDEDFGSAELKLIPIHVDRVHEMTDPLPWFSPPHGPCLGGEDSIPMINHRLNNTIDHI